MIGAPRMQCNMNLSDDRHQARAEGGGGRRVLEHLPLCPVMPKVPFCQGNFFFFFFFFLTTFCEGLPNRTISTIND